MKQVREADDAYLEGAKQIEHKNLAAAERSFEQAVHLDPNNRDYALALIVTRENYVTELVQDAAKARARGDAVHADALLDQARTLDPDNRVVAQHFEAGTTPVTSSPKAKAGPGLFYSSIDPMKFPAKDIASTLRGPVELEPLKGMRNIHLQGDPQSVIRNLYNLYGIATSFDSSVSSGAPISLDMDNVSFADATRVLSVAAQIFAVPVQPKTVLIAKDTQENRSALMPQVEETVYLPGRTNDEMQELANVARNVFDVKQVTASATGGYLLLRGDVNVLKQVNAVYDDMLDGSPEVLFDVTLYELDKTTTNNIGATLPGSAGAFDLLSSAQTLINSNQSLINQAVAGGLLSYRFQRCQRTDRTGISDRRRSVRLQPIHEFTRHAWNLWRTPSARSFVGSGLNLQFRTELKRCAFTGYRPDPIQQPPASELPCRHTIPGGHGDL
jgi:general secretion pathway protein D